MQKVEGSSPFIRLIKPPGNGGFFYWSLFERGPAITGWVRVRRDRLDAHDAVVLGDHPGELGRCEPGCVQPLQVCFGRPTGDSAALSDVDGNLVVEKLLQ